MALALTTHPHYTQSVICLHCTGSTEEQHLPFVPICFPLHCLLVTPMPSVTLTSKTGVPVGIEINVSCLRVQLAPYVMDILSAGLGTLCCGLPARRTDAAKS